MNLEKCPCGINKAFSQCCGPLLARDVEASQPEQLMRSRYCAFTMKNMDYILETMDPQTRGTFDREENQKWAEQVQFFKLEVLRSSEEANKGLVEFKAHYRADAKDFIHHEVSKFRKQAGRWYFREGKIINTEA